MNLLPWTISFSIVGALSEGELHRPLAEIQKDFNAEIQKDFLLQYRRISTKKKSFFWVYLVADLSGDEELLHGHVVHRREVLDGVLLATLPSV